MSIRPQFFGSAMTILVIVAVTGCVTSGPITEDGAVNTDGSANASDAAGDGSAPGASLPCAVDRFLADRCQSCHGATPIGGAPMSLVTYADTQAAARSDSSQRVWQMMTRRVHDSARPMPPTGLLSDTDLSPLDSWLRDSAPSGVACAPSDAGNADAGSDAAPIGAAALPCPESERTTFLAHGTAAGSAYQVPLVDNTHVCFTFRSPFAAGSQATAFAPVIDEARTVHHFILYETATPQTDGAFGNCHMPLDATFVSGWAPGVGNVVLPPTVGQQLGATGQRWYILQLHYYNIARLPDANDRSGVALCRAPTPRPDIAAIVTLGTSNIDIPAHDLAYSTTGNCAPPIAEPLHVIRAAPHMHLLGTSIRTEIVRAGGGVESLINVPRWDFEGQSSYPVDTLVNPGDMLRTTCNYANTTNAPVRFGENTENEMCFDFLTVWPIRALTAANGTVQQRCVGR